MSSRLPDRSSLKFLCDALIFFSEDLKRKVGFTCNDYKQGYPTETPLPGGLFLLVVHQPAHIVIEVLSGHVYLYQYAVLHSNKIIDLNS